PAAVRGLLAGIYLVSRMDYPRKIFDNVGEATAWLVESASAGCPGAVSAPDVEAAAARLRQAVHGELEQQPGETRDRGGAPRSARGCRGAGHGRAGLRGRALLPRRRRERTGHILGTVGLFRQRRGRRSQACLAQSLLQRGTRVGLAGRRVRDGSIRGVIV